MLAEWKYDFSKTKYENRIESWPTGWGEDLHVLIYDDFNPPKSDIQIDFLGITIHPDKIQKTPVHSALCVLDATVKIQERSVTEIENAIRRINIFLGALTLVSWGNVACGWWSYVTHQSGGGVVVSIDHEDLLNTITGILKLPEKIRKKINAALFWIRNSRNSILETYRSDILRIYSSYWNVLECLVDAINLHEPQDKLSQKNKQNLIDDFFKKRSNKLSPQNINGCYHEIVDPGFVGKASHAFQVVFTKNASFYIDECFKKEPKNDRLYDIRNAINHGEVDAENPFELERIEKRLDQLFLIIWNIFGHIVRFPTPVDQSVSND